MLPKSEVLRIVVCLFFSRSIDEISCVALLLLTLAFSTILHLDMIERDEPECYAEQCSLQFPQAETDLFHGEGYHHRGGDNGDKIDRKNRSCIRAGIIESKANRYKNEQHIDPSIEQCAADLGPGSKSQGRLVVGIIVFAAVTCSSKP